MKKIVIVAGDKSADIYAGLLCKELKEILPQIEIFSFAGGNSTKYSTQIINLLEQTVTGFTEVIKKLPQIFKVFNSIVEKIHEIKPDLIILLDFPDFNLRLAKKLDKIYPLFYYISPQIWAWRKNRVEIIKKYVDKMVVIFKFEKAFYEKEGLNALYFGHPILDVIKDISVIPKKIISLMPGSRENEIKKHLPIMLKAKEILAEKLPDYEFRIIRPQNITESFYLTASDLKNTKMVSHSYSALKESSFILATSGTTTIELAVLNVPFILMYKINWLSWLIAKTLVKVKFAGMVNILAGKKIIDEFLQAEAKPEKIANCTLEILSNQNKYNQIKENLQKVAQTLLPKEATKSLASYISEYLSK